MVTRAQLHDVLEQLYRTYNHRKWVSPDPLETVYGYNDPCDREISGFIASSLAYGRVAQILASVDKVLAPMGPSPRDYLADNSPAILRKNVEGFRHRWTDAQDMGALLCGIREVLHRHGSLEACFLEHQPGDATNGLPGLTGLIDELREFKSANSLLPEPNKGSACKRLHMYLRWMVRRDDVDPGCWGDVSPSLLLVPLDTHLHRVARAWRMTRRKQADLKAAEEVTGVFRRMVPEDPVRYDFVLTRFGIRPDMDMNALISEVNSGTFQPTRSTPQSTPRTIVRSTSGK